MRTIRGCVPPPENRSARCFSRSWKSINSPVMVVCYLRAKKAMHFYLFVPTHFKIKKLTRPRHTDNLLRLRFQHHTVVSTRWKNKLISAYVVSACPFCDFFLVFLFDISSLSLLKIGNCPNLKLGERAKLVNIDIPQTADLSREELTERGEGEGLKDGGALKGRSKTLRGRKQSGLNKNLYNNNNTIPSRADHGVRVQPSVISWLTIW